jgi:thiol-disulfide isomerase/thioredoxin
MRIVPSLSLPSRFALLTCLLATALLFGCNDGAVAGPPVKVGAVVPKLAFRTLDGKPFSLEEHKGDVVLLDFWATWCGPCHIQARILEPIHRDFKDRGVKFFAVDLGESPATVKKFLTKNPLPYATLVDPDDSASDRLDVYALPTLLIIDRQGRIAFLESSVVDGQTVRSVLQKATS